MRRMMQTMLGKEPTFQVAKQASWSLRALSGGYAVEAGKTEATAGPYRLIGEALESLAATVELTMQDADAGNLNYRFTSNGKRYLSALVRVPRSTARA